jgi:hypothetical protein
MVAPDARQTVGTDEVAERLGIATSTLNLWLRADQQRPAGMQVFAFHRWRGRCRVWSEEAFEQLEQAIHRESQYGVLCAKRAASRSSDAADPDATDALARILSKKRGL